MKLATFALPLALSLGAVTTAHALPTPNGSFSGYSIGATTANGVANGGVWQIGTSTTTITASSNHGISSTVDPYLGNINNLSILNGGSITDGDAFTLSSNIFTVFTGVLGSPLTLTVDSYTFEFTQEIASPVTNGNIGLWFGGNLIADTDGLLAVPAAASFSATFTQSAPTGGIGVGYSLDTPPAPPPSVPEPATLSLFGLGLAGIAAARRRKA